MDGQKDERLWHMAKKRASFKKNLVSYFLISAFLWIVWWFTAGRHSARIGFPWPAWVMLGWGIGLVFNYLEAYYGNKETMTEREYEKLKKEQEGR